MDVGQNQKIEVVASADVEDETCQTYVIHGEDHTLGNSLRYIIMKNPEVEFCGYSIPHPSESKLNLRIQTKGTPAVDILQKGLKDLNQLSEHILKTFTRSVDEWRSREGDGAMDTSS